MPICRKKMHKVLFGPILIMMVLYISQNKSFNRRNASFNRENTSFNRENTPFNRENTSINRQDTFNRENTPFNRENTSLSSENTSFNRQDTFNKRNTSFNRENTSFNRENTSFNRQDTFNKRNTSFNREKASFNRLNASFNRENTSVNRENVSFNRQNLPFNRANASFNRQNASLNRPYSVLNDRYSMTPGATLTDEIEPKQKINRKYLNNSIFDKFSSNFNHENKDDKFQSLLNVVKENSYVKDYVKKMKELYDDLFYKVYPVSVGVQEVPITPLITNVNKEEEEEEEDPERGLSVTSHNLPGCRCLRHYPRVKDPPGFVTLKRYSTDRHMATRRRVKKISSCSEEASARGPKQRVVSYSYFGNTSDLGLYNRYFSEIRARATEIQQHYPDFVMRVYHDVGPEDEKGRREMCRAYCDFPHLDFCNVRELPEPWFDFSAKQKVGTMWRFLTLMDPLVDMTMFRDLDSYVLPREVAAVDEWLQSDSPYHVMRDHPLHNAQILAGLWGCQTHLDRGNSYHYGAMMLSQPYSDLWDYDQRLLRRILWPLIRNITMVHDSYTCKASIFQGQGSSRPFPTQREGLNYTGYGKTKIRVTKLLTACPLVCRPPSHRDWILC